MKGKLKLFLLLTVLSVFLITTVVFAAGLNKTSITIPKGKTYILKLTGTSLKSYCTYRKKIATISFKDVIKENGVNTTRCIINGVEAGTTTVEIKGTNNKTYKCKVTVVDSYLNKTSISVYTGKNYNLKLTGTKIKSVSSTNKKIATITKSGIVKGLKAGTTTVSIKGTNNKIYKCKVKVVDPYLNKTTTTLCVGKTTTLKINGSAIKSVSTNASFDWLDKYLPNSFNGL